MTVITVTYYPAKTVKNYCVRVSGQVAWFSLGNVT